MKNKLITALLLIVASVSPALATDLVNYDAKPYAVTLVEGSVTQTVKISAKGANYGLCTSGPCTLTLNGSSVTVDKNDRVVIENGKLTKK